MKKKILTFFKLSVTLFLFYLIFQQIEFKELTRLLQKVNIAYILLTLLLYLPALFSSAIRWNLILASLGLQFSHREATKIYWVSSFFNNFLPTSIGGDAYKFFYLNRINNKAKLEFLSSMIIERAMGVLAMGLFVLFFGFYFLETLKQNHTFLIFYILITVGSLVMAFLLSHKIAFQLKTTKRYDFLNSLIRLINLGLTYGHPKIFLKTLILSFVYLFSGILSIYLVFLAFKPDTSCLLICFLIPLINFTELVPISINSLGIKEGAALYLFSLFGYSAELVLSVFLISRIILLVVSSTGGLGFLLMKKTPTLKDVRDTDRVLDNH